MKFKNTNEFFIPPPSMNTHAITLRGHRTSLSLEPEFWQEIKRLAAADGRPLAALIADIDSQRGTQGLSSAVRVYVLRQLLKAVS